ncbi:helix-hairpin-helix domain-containing protein [Streptomyces lutosisoli]|uniref:Helix-hairpin-helix domain-containing protein n=1 Tax=Streptomyces lutosisoli TaxID=2665721 RepID=A0ABW2VKJ6_9ACTN
MGDGPKATTVVGVGVADVRGLDNRVRGALGRGGSRVRGTLDLEGAQAYGSLSSDDSWASGAVDCGAPGAGAGAAAPDAGAAADTGARGGVRVGAHHETHAAHVDVASSTAESGAWRDRIGLAVRERMPLWLQSRCGLERKNVAALTVLLVVAAVFAMQHFWAGRTQSVRAPEVVRAAAPYGAKTGQGEQSDAGPDASAGAPSPAGTVMVVDVSGKVRSPGLQRLPTGSRVEDALRAAGGVRPGTNTEGLNRARLLVDGEQIVVGAPASAVGPGTGGAGPVGAGGSTAGAAPSAPVALNTATVDQLDGLPGVGPVLARHIIDYRTQHGGFRSVDELREVNGIGDRRFADLRNLVRP